MKTLLILFIASVISASAATPPMPKNFVLQSPKAAAVVKDKKMLSTQVDISGPTLPPVFDLVVKDINFFGCDVSNPTCQLYDMEQPSSVQLMGIAVKLQYSDEVPAMGWTTAATFYAPAEDREIGAVYYTPAAQRHTMRVWRTMSFTPEFTTAAPGRIVKNPVMGNMFTPWSRPKKK